MTHPIASILTPAELKELSRKVQFCEATWPQCYEMGEPIHMPTINTLADLLEHLGVADQRPTEISVYEASRIHEWLRMAWNHGAEAKAREVHNELQASRVQAEMDAAATEREQFRVRCQEVLAKQKRAKRAKRGGH